VSTRRKIKGPIGLPAAPAMTLDEMIAAVTLTVDKLSVWLEDQGFDEASRRVTLRPLTVEDFRYTTRSMGVEPRGALIAEVLRYATQAINMEIIMEAERIGRIADDDQRREERRAYEARTPARNAACTRIGLVENAAQRVSELVTIPAERRVTRSPNLLTYEQEATQLILYARSARVK
jgi:hypothetical protein